jgi:adenylate cyclase class IV
VSRNIEFKARATDFRRQSLLARELSGTPGETMVQKDVFFRVPEGRLKLRTFGDGGGELIGYQRADVCGPRDSTYWIARTRATGFLESVLEATLGILGTVRKRRTLHLVGQARIHLDEVDSLGEFIEVEVVLEPGQEDAEAARMAAGLMTRLEISQEDLVAEAYVDLLPIKR